MVVEFVLIFIIGSCIGSFCNVLIHRLPKNEDVVFSRSKCPKCNKQIFWWHNIPLISFFILGFRCYFCKEKISYIYITTEILIALIWVIVFYKIGFTLESFVLSLIFSLLFSLSIIDIRYKAVPDSINISALSITFLYGILSVDFINHISNMLIIIALFYVIRLYISYFMKQEAMGEGDILIGGIMGGMLGIELSLLCIFLSSLIALPFSIYAKIKGQLELPFIPFLAISIFLIFIFDDFSKGVLSYVIG